jgi:hypothetical protein
MFQEITHKAKEPIRGHSVVIVRLEFLVLKTSLFEVADTDFFVRTDNQIENPQPKKGMAFVDWLIANVIQDAFPCFDLFLIGWKLGNDSVDICLPELTELRWLEFQNIFESFH